jgi:phasin family protein
MPDASNGFTDMFKQFGEQLKIPTFDTHKIMEQHQKNIDAMSRSWQAMVGGVQAIADKQREILEATWRDIGEMARDYQPTAPAQDLLAKQGEFAKKAMEAAISNTRDIAELVQKSGSEAIKIIHERMQESYEEIRTGLEKK